jgi:hypothetical protein
MPVGASQNLGAVQRLTFGVCPMQLVLLFFMSVVIMIDIYLAQKNNVKQSEIFYGVAALMLFGAFVVLSRMH